MIAKVSALILLFFSLNFYAQDLSPKTNQPDQPDELAKHLSAAETYQISGDLVNAQIENRAIIAIGLQRFGNISIEEGKLQDAVKTLSESRNYADNASVRIDLAAAYLQMNEIEKALQEAMAAVNLDPKNAYARYILGNIYYTKEDYAAALPELEKVLILAPDFDSARALGLTYLHLKQPERAKLLFEEMQTSLKKDSADLHVIFGQAYEQTNYPLEAEREFKRALAINSKQPRANLFLGYVILQYGGSGRLAEAGQAFERELQLTPNDFFPNFFAGVTASSENNHAKAVGLLQKAVQLSPNSSEANLFLGQSQMETGDLKTAEKTLRRAIDLAVNSSKNGFESRRAHYMLGRLLVADGRREEGETELAKARELQTKLIMTTRDELSALFSQVVSDTKKLPAKSVAANQANQQVDLSPQTIAELKKLSPYLSEVLAQAYYNLGVIAVQNNQLPEALEKFAAAAEWKPDFPNVDRSAGIVAFRAAQFDKAIAPLARHIKNAPQDNLARQMLGASYYFTKDFKNAVATLKPIEPVITDDAELAYFYGISLIQVERNQEAELIFNKLAQSSQKAPEILTNVAQGFMLLGDYERAIKEFRTIAAIAPNMLKVNYFIGQSLIRLNRFDEAEKYFQKELELNPSDETSKYHLALTLIERKIRTDEALKLLIEAIALRSDYADAHYQLGKIYIEKGETEKAIAQLEAAANADAKKDYIHYQLSIAYRKAGKQDDAARELKLYQALKAENRKTENLMPMGSDKMLRKNFIVQFLTINLLIFCAVNFISAQQVAVDKNVLAKFEKNIDEGNYSIIERDLLNYAISNPKDARGFELLARLRFAQNRLNEAKSLYQKTLSLDPKLTTAKINLAVINFQTGNAEQSASLLNEISEADISSDTIRINLANAFALTGDCQKALSVVEKLDIKLKNSDALPLRAKCYLSSGESQKINSLIPLAKNIIKQNPLTAIKVAKVLSDSAMYKESADVLRSVVAVAPQNSDALILLAKSEIYTKDLANAKIHLLQASKINQNSPDLLFVQSLLESEQGNSSASLDLMEKSLAANPNSTEVLSQFVVTAMRANQAGKAVQAAEKLLELKPDEPEFLYLYGAASLQNNKLSTAEISLNRFAELRPKDSRGCLALGLTFAAQPEKLEDARRQLLHCVETDPNNFEAQYQLGLSYKTQGETTKAIEYLEAAVKSSPDYALALRDLGTVYLQSGAETKARIVLEKSAAINPNDADTHFQLSRLYNLLGETELAKKHLETFQKLRNPKKDGM